MHYQIFCVLSSTLSVLSITSFFKSSWTLSYSIPSFIVFRLLFCYFLSSISQKLSLILLTLSFTKYISHNLSHIILCCISLNLKLSNLWIYLTLKLMRGKRMLFALIFHCISALFVMKMISALFGWSMTQSFLKDAIFLVVGQESTSQIILIKNREAGWQIQIISKTITLHHLHLIWIIQVELLRLDPIHLRLELLAIIGHRTRAILCSPRGRIQT